MQTYMDGLFVNAAKSLRRDGLDDDLHSVAEAIIEYRQDEKTAGSLDAPYEWPLLFCAFLADAVGDAAVLKSFKKEAPPRQYFKVSRNLVIDLFAAPPPETPYTDWFGEFCGPDSTERITYIDIAPGSVSLRGMDLRQISLLTFPADDNGNDHGALMIQGLVTAKDRSPYLPDVFSLFDSAEFIGQAKLGPEGDDFKLARSQVVNFIRCLGLYLRDRRDNGITLPLVPRIDPKVRPNRGRDLNKTRSLFTIYELKESARAAAQPVDREQVKLGHQVEVRGHWRWQAWGEKHSLRKLLWIDGHIRGADLPKVKPRMEYLRT